MTTTFAQTIKKSFDYVKYTPSSTLPKVLRTYNFSWA